MNTTTKIRLLGAMLTVFCLAAAAADAPVKSLWLAVPPTIDGVPADWPNPAFINEAGGDVG
jgi:hypothetical protein